ncbi:chromate efflux transporter [Pseudohongiella sp.]|jgi:chromate transporter|uniref:Chromate transporter n=1 Tax=marine sediment metagenome TaxID=412755 RepID=A0A0F9Z367_9ZZZZ|nr:chromate efflux transporter [Pseudohongiella sp.]HDZ09185.1 chromate efflux transporter [Pseudohongiella sp.]
MTDTRNVKAEDNAPETGGHNIPFSEALWVWMRVAALSFGGPAGQIAVMHRILVEEKKWIGENRFLHALNYCMLLPGPEAQQLAIYIGWLLHKTKGGLAAGILFVLPGFLSIMALSYIYVLYGNISAVEGLFFGLKTAVLAIVLQAVVRIGSRALKNNVMLGLAAAAFVAIFFLGIPFPLIILSAALIGYFGGRTGMPAFVIDTSHGKQGEGLSDEDSALGATIPAHAKPTVSWSIRISLILLILWFGPIVLLIQTVGMENVFSQIAIFFSKMAMATFGGAYAVLAYVSQAAVENFGWLTPEEMLDGLGMAETTPGPLIQVVQFVGFLAAFRDPGTMNPYTVATFAAVLTTWVTFVPCFLWIFLGAPFIETLRGHKALSAALAAITAAVAGVILNLALWFAMHVLFEVREIHAYGLTVDVPVLNTIDIPSLLMTIAALLAVFYLKIGMIKVLGLSALVGMAFYSL